MTDPNSINQMTDELLGEGIDDLSNLLASLELIAANNSQNILDARDHIDSALALLTTERDKYLYAREDASFNK